MENLMQPRYKVIADYPESECFVGSIICKSGDRYRDESGFMVRATNKPENYPVIFKKLEWWEDRTAKELETVKYVKSYKGSYVRKVDRWDMSDLERGYEWCLFLDGNFVPYSPNGYQPATEEEYNTYTHPLNNTNNS